MELDAQNNTICSEYVNGKPYGTYICFDNDEKPLTTVWNKIDPDPSQDIVDIPCVFGASYSCNKKYWTHLKGLIGLRSYGADEELISIKVWLEGGRCRLIKNIEIGHFFRQVMPYRTLNEDFIYNRLYIAELFLPKENKYRIFSIMDKIDNNSYKKALKLLSLQRDSIREQKEYYSSVFTKDINYVIDKNRFLKDRGK